MPKKIHGGATMVLSVRVEIKDVARLDKVSRKMQKTCDYAERDDYTRNSIIVSAIKSFLEENE